MVRSIYVVTHPEATHHVERVVGGWHDSRLTPVGIRAAVSIAEALRSWIPADAEVEVISSDLQRTRRTAGEAATVFDVEPIEDHRLRERSYGVAEGRPSACVAGPEGAFVGESRMSGASIGVSGAAEGSGTS